MLCFNSDDTILNPAKGYISNCKICLKEQKLTRKKAEIDSLENKSYLGFDPQCYFLF